MITKFLYLLPLYFLCIFVTSNIKIYKTNYNMNIKSTNEQNNAIDGNNKIIIDCKFTLTEALKGIKIPDDIKSGLTLAAVEYYSFDGKLHRGQLVINKDLKKDIILVFKEMKKIKFPVAKVIPIAAYNWSDLASMEDNNTSAFNYRFIKGTKRLSNHALGRAIDINPLFNPQIKGKEVLPPDGSYKPGRPGTITKDSPVVKFFKEKGWKWGGDWRSSKDYQHFEKLK